VAGPFTCHGLTALTMPTRKVRDMIFASRPRGRFNGFRAQVGLFWTSQPRITD